MTNLCATSQPCSLKSRLAVCLIVLGGLVFGALPVHAGVINYTYIPLPGNSVPLGINDRGQIVGTLYPPTNTSGPHAFLWQNGVMTNIGANLPGYSIAYDINDSGTIVGAAGVGWVAGQIANKPADLIGNNAFVLSGSDVTLLPNFGENGSTAIGINDVGQIVGTAAGTGPAVGDYSAYRDAFLSDGSALTDISPTRYVLYGSVAEAINNSGTVVGLDYSPDHFGYSRPAIFTGGHAVEFTDSKGYAVDVNDRNQIVGNATDTGGPSGLQHAYIYSAGQMAFLPFLPGAGDATAQAINNSGFVVGGSGSNGFLYDGSSMYNLNDLIDTWDAPPEWGKITVGMAVDINDDGWIIGWGGPTGAYLLKPDASAVPEPSSLIVFGGCLAVTGIAAAVRKRRRLEVELGTQTASA